jgi:hypothetical protein
MRKRDLDEASHEGITRNGHQHEDRHGREAARIQRVRTARRPERPRPTPYRGEHAHRPEHEATEALDGHGAPLDRRRRRTSALGVLWMETRATPPLPSTPIPARRRADRQPPWRSRRSVDTRRRLPPSLAPSQAHRHSPAHRMGPNRQGQPVTSQRRPALCPAVGCRALPFDARKSPCAGFKSESRAIRCTPTRRQPRPSQRVDAHLTSRDAS